MVVRSLFIISVLCNSGSNQILMYVISFVIFCRDVSVTFGHQKINLRTSNI